MAEGDLVDHHNTFHFSLDVCFWLETGWYCLMFVERLLALIVFTRDGNSKEIISSVLGIVGIVCCLVLLMVSETMRCCLTNESNHVWRLLASESPPEEYGGYNASDGLITKECSCDAFGTRTYGGLGNIEPFTFLIMLWPLRFLLAGPISRLFRMQTHTELIHNEKTAHGHHHGADSEAVRNIWLATIGSHSDLAKKHGIFSVEVLYCMLGLEIPDHHLLNVQDDTSELDNSTPFGSRPESDKTSEITSYQDTNMQTLQNSLGIAFDENEFAFPDSSLIRRMRRCERRLLPLLDTWMLVDVILT
jgi:hypothetical protein